MFTLLDNTQKAGGTSLFLLACFCMLCSQTLKYGQKRELLLQCLALCSAKGMQHVTFMYTAEIDQRRLSIACIQRMSFVCLLL